MARHTVIVCDCCGNPTTEIAGKLSWVPRIHGSATMNFSNYSHSAHIGVCCREKVFQFANFSKRMSAEEYAEKRKKDGKRSTVRARKINNAA